MAMWKPLFLLAGVIVVLTVGPLQAEPFSVPISDLMIHGRISVNGKAVGFSSREGSTLYVQGEGFRYSFIPVINPETGSPNFAAYEVCQFAPGETVTIQVDRGQDIKEEGESVQFVFTDAKNKVDPNIQAHYVQHCLDTGQETPKPSVAIQVIKVAPGRFPKVALVDTASADVPELRRRFGAAGGGLCFLSHEGVTVGAYSVAFEKHGFCTSGSADQR